MALPAPNRKGPSLADFYGQMNGDDSRNTLTSKDADTGWVSQNHLRLSALIPSPPKLFAGRL